MYRMNKEPLHKIIYRTITDKISSQYYKSGDALPSESELEKLFETSRTPVRQALKQLETDGLIYRLQGKGSYVANQKPRGQWTTMTGFSDIYQTEWERIHARLIEARRIESPYYARLLNIRDDVEINHLKRVRFLNGKPVIYLEHYLIPKLPLEIFKKDPSFMSVDQLLKDEANIEFFSIKEEIEAIPANKQIAKCLKITPGEPVIKSTRVSSDDMGVAIDVTVNFFSSKNWKYKIEFHKR
ncbi:GntR family transcriptional regulator [Sporolactobacillus sp. THM7-4]|nr:GntR family transcriptional regulator [Sporolactobacillus sp. THM7-4]